MVRYSTKIWNLRSAPPIVEKLLRIHSIFELLQMTLTILRMAKLGMARKVETVRHICACSEQHIYRHWWQVEAVDRTALRTEWRAERAKLRKEEEGSKLGEGGC